jgi:hypothetical protein
MRKALILTGLVAGGLAAIVLTLQVPTVLQSQTQRTATPYLITPGGPTVVPPVGHTPAPERDLAPQLDRQDKVTYIIRHPNGSYESLLVPPGWGYEEVKKVIGPDDTIQGFSFPPSFKHIPGTPPPIPPGVFPPLPAVTPTWFPPPPTQAP